MKKIVTISRKKLFFVKNNVSCSSTFNFCSKMIETDIPIRIFYTRFLKFLTRPWESNRDSARNSLCTLFIRPLPALRSLAGGQPSRAGVGKISRKTIRESKN